MGVIYVIGEVIDYEGDVYGMFIYLPSLGFYNNYVSLN